MIDRDAAKIVILKFQADPKNLVRAQHHPPGASGDFGPDAVAGQASDFISHAWASSYASIAGN